MQRTPERHALYLIPGFFGFANLGRLRYFVHVDRFLRERCAARGVDARVHVVHTHPTATLPARAELVSEALSQAGFETARAKDLAELEKEIAARSPDLVLVDVQMPEAFGDDVAMVLRCARGVGAPIYLLSGLDEAELAERAAAIEIEGYISKRGGVEQIVERVKNILGSTP